MKRSFMKMKNIFAAVVFLVSVFYVFVSCSNLYDDVGRENSTQNNNDEINAICCVTGSVSPGSALPSELCSIFNQNINSSKTAFPSVPTSGVSLQITAMNNDDNSKKYYAICHTDTFPWSFELNMPVGSYTLTAELKQNSKVIMSYKDTCVVLTESDPILNKEILLDAKQTNDGEGELSLLIKDETTIGLGEIEFDYITDSESFSFEDKSVLIDTSGLISGSYSASITFYKNAEIIYKIPLEKINVFDNMTTDTWYKYGQEPYLQQNDDGTASCVITDDCINRYAITNIWVHPTKGNDENSGDGSAPVKTIGRAAEIVKNSLSAGPFTINLVDGAYDVDEQIVFNKSVKIIGSSMEGTVINDSISDSFIRVNSPTGSSAFEISLNNLTYKFSTDKTANSGLLSIQNTGGFKSFNLKKVCVTNESSEKKIKKPLIQTNSTVQLNIDNCNFSNLKLRPTEDFDANMGAFNPLIKSTGTTTIKNTVFENIDVELTVNLKGMIWCTDTTTFEKVYFYSNSIKDHESCPNSCDVRGGMIYNQGTLTLDHVTFGVDSNKNDKPIEIKNGGNIYGGLVYNEKAMTCKNCNFINCQMQNANQNLRIAGAVYSTTATNATSAGYVIIQFSTFLKNSAANSNKIWGTGLCVYPSSNINPVVKLGNSIYFDDSSDIYLGVGPGSDNNTYNGQLELGSGMELWDSFNGKTMSYFATISSSLDDSGNYNTTVPVMTGDVGHKSRYFKVKPTGTGDDAINWKIKEVPEGSGSVGKFAYDIDTVSSIGAGNLAAWLSDSNNKVIGVESAEDIVALANLTDETFEGKTIKLVNDITLTSEDPKFNLFKGTFDGCNKKITFDDHCELMAQTRNCEIKNLHTDGNIKGRGLISIASDDITIRNCVNDANVNCSEGSQRFAGAFIGYYTSSSGNVNLINCKNNGDMTGTIAGGLIGDLGYSSNSNLITVNITNCSNAGKITATGSGSSLGQSGGIIGYVINKVKLVIDRCYNTNEITGRACGGIVGTGNSSAFSIEITNSYNTGNISASEEAGGIVGQMYFNSVTVRNCYNSGSINTDNEYKKHGGIAGWMQNIGSYKNCINYGTVSSPTVAGGCFGIDQSAPSFINCYSYYPDEENENYPAKVVYNKNNAGTVNNYKIENSIPIVGESNLIQLLNDSKESTDCVWKIDTTTHQPYFTID